MDRPDQVVDVFIDVLLALIVAVAPVATDIAWAMLAEEYLLPRLYPPGAPRLSHGQEWGLLLVMIAAPLGMVGGMSVVLAPHKRFAAAAAVSLGAAVLAILLLVPLWTEDVRRNSYEPTELVVYPVPVLSAAAILGWSCVMAGAAFRCSLAQEKRRG